MIYDNERSLSTKEWLMKVIVIGGGIGGMAAALSLQDEGIEVEVYERAPALTEIGAGLQIAPSAGRVLERLGLGAELERLAITMQRLQMHDLRTDRLIHSVSPNWGGRFYQVHRPDLLAMLSDALALGVVRLGERAVGFVEDADGVTVEFESGHRARGDVLIGADGIHSLVRQHLFGEQELDFSHIVAWRALIPRERLAHLDLARNCEVWLGAKRSAVTYWVHSGELLNFVGMVPARDAAEESWTATGELGALRRSYAGSCERLEAIIEAIETPFITGYYFRYPLESWSRGRIALLGDAAHPMHPFLAQGACQAIEDAAVLGHVLASCGGSDVQRALAEYAHRRLPRASRVQNSSRTLEHVWHMSDPAEIVQRNRTLRSVMEIDPDAESIYGWVYRYDADAEARRPLGAASGPLQRPEAQRAWTQWATLLGPRDLDRRHHGIRDAYDRFLLENFHPQPDVTIAEEERDGLRSLSATARESGPVVLHLHGGGYLVGSPEASVGLASRLASAVGGTCVVPGYRRAPEHPFPAPVEDAVAAYERLLADGVDAARVLISGESAGGGLALALAMRVRDLDLPLPAGVVVMSPMADMALTGASLDEADSDPISTRPLLTQMATSYLQGHDPRDPLASPVYGDFRGLPPLLVQVARNEALYSDADRVADAARRDGVQVELDRYPDTVHVFQIFDFLPEATAALARVGEFARTVVQVPAYHSEER
jgi:salicylate hydroxylase